MPQRWNQLGGAGAAGPPGPSGAGGTAPDAPNILDDATTKVTVIWEANGHDWNRGFQIDLHLPTADVNYAHLIEVDVSAVEAGGKSIAISPLLHSLFTGTTLSFHTDNFPTSTPIAAESWTLTFRCVNEDGKVTASPTVRTVAVTPPTITSASVVETGPRSVTNTERAVATSLTVTPVLSVNLGGVTGIQYVTVWTKYAWGDPDKGPDPITTRKGIFPITGLTSPILLTGDNQVFITAILAGTTVSVYLALGAWDGTAIPPSATLCTYSMAGPAQPPGAGNWITGANFTGLSSQLQYFAIGGGSYGFKFGALAFTATFSAHPTMQNVRCYVQNGKWNGSAWAAKTGDAADKSFCDVRVTKADANTTIVVTGDSVTVNVVFPWSVWLSTDPFPDVRIHLDVIPIAGAIVTQASFSGQSSPCSEIIFSSDGQFAYIQPSIAKALLTATPWDPATFGDRLGLVGGRLNVTTPLAPPPTAVSVATVRSTGATTLSAIGGLPAWNADLTVTLNTASPTYSHTKALQVQIPGFQPFTVTSWTLVGSITTITIPTEYEDSVAKAYTATVFAVNEDGVASAGVSTTINVPGATVPFSGGSAPAAPVITVLTATVVFLRNGHDFSFAFAPGFTAPTTGPYSVVFSKISPSGARAVIGTLYGPPTGGQFQSGIVYGFTGEAVDVVAAVTQGWTVEAIAVNADNIPTLPAKQIPVTVAPNTVSGITGAEGATYIEGGQGAKTHAVISGTIGTANGPGVSVASPQVLTFYFSADNGATWFGLGWIDIATTSFSQTFELWRPTDVAKSSCKVAVAINAWNWPDGTFRSPGPAGPLAAASLPTGTSQSAIFTIGLVGAPSASACTNVSVLARTATGGALYQGVTIGVAGADKTAYWGVQPGLQFTNPNNTDPNFFYARFKVYCVQAGTPGPGLGEVSAPADQMGAPTYHSGAQEFVPGAVNICTDIDGWPFNPVGSAFTVMRIVLVAFSRSGLQTVQNVWSGSPPNTGITYNGTYCDITFGPPPASNITATLTASSIGSGMYLDTAGKLQLTETPKLANGSFEEGSLGGTPSGWTIGGGQIGTVTTVVNPLSNATNPSSRCVALAGSHSSVVQTFACNPGDMFYLTDFVYASGADGLMRCGLIWLNSSQGFISITEAPQIGAPGTWTRMSVSGTAPLGTAFVQVFLSTNGNSFGTWYVDNADLSPTGKLSVSNGLGFDASGNLIVSANSEFKFVGGQLQINGVDFTKGFNSFAVGSAALPQITISPGGTPMGWIGSDAASGFTGAWFKRVLIGGTSPANAPFFADAAGNVSISGSLITGTIITAQLSVANVVGWNLANISVGSGITFTGANYTTRINVTASGSLSAFAVSSNGPIMSTAFVSQPANGVITQTTPFAQFANSGIFLDDFGQHSVYVTLSSTVLAGGVPFGGKITIQSVGHQMDITSQHIWVDGVLKI